MNELSYLNNANSSFVEDLYQQYKNNPHSVEEGWRRFFEGFELGCKALGNGHSNNGKSDNGVGTQTLSGANSHLVDPSKGTMRDKEIAAMKLINAYRDRGHLISKTNSVRPRRALNADLNLDYFHLTEEDLDRKYQVGHQIRIGKATLREILAHLTQTYCASVGAEFRYIPDSRIRMWLHEQMESIANTPKYPREQKLDILKKLAQAVGFEKFLHVKFTGQKRFSLEGCESFVPALDALIEQGSDLGVKELVIGMAHRGRLNLLVNLFGKSYEQVFAEFEGIVPDNIHGDGDVKYHMGHSVDVVTDNGKQVHLSLMFNPSHLEAVDPVTLGSCRAKMDALYDGDTSSLCPVLVHGDAAIAGQGVVYEVANLARLDGFSTGGTIHIVLNNQVGFTANYRETRSSLYCTDIAKVTECPVFHVNADDPEAVVHVCQMAIKLRQMFKTDVYIDILGYRRYGHNEGDDPRFTQPLLYKRIADHPTVMELYAKRLIEDKTITQDEADQIASDFNQLLQDSLKSAREKPEVEYDFLGRQWKGLRRSKPSDFDESPETGVSARKLAKVADAIVSVPEGFTIYPKMQKLIDRRRKLFFEERQVDWGVAELLAYGSLLTEDTAVRLSGQDSRRGTFSHRHSVLVDANDETRYFPLNHIQKKQERFQVYNTLLSEYGVLGFEFGYSIALPNALIVWEAQFGDFANGAQIIIDQFLSSSESKWNRMSGITLFLPHGNEGMGPEHSSARILRYLELCAEHNIVVANPTTPANLFHLLRRQVKVKYRKPLVVFTPKSYLKHPVVRSSVAELQKGRFREILDDENVAPEKTKRVILCSGKIYYELLARRNELERDDVALVRLEQMYPIPEPQDMALVKRYDHVEDWVWVQEEAVNMGPWSFMRRRFDEIRKLRVVSRPESASPATGSAVVFKQTQSKLLDDAFADLP